MNHVVNCFGEIKCPDGLESLVQELQAMSYSVSYRSSFGGKNHSAIIQFDDDNMLETDDSDGQDCLFSGEFTDQQSAKQLLRQFSQALKTLNVTHRFEAYQSADELVCYVHFQWPQTSDDDQAFKKSKLESPPE